MEDQSKVYTERVHRRVFIKELETEETCNKGKDIFTKIFLGSESLRVTETERERERETERERERERRERERER